MMRPRFLSKLFSRRAASAVAKLKSEVVTLPNWEALIQAFMQRAEKLDETDLFMIHFKNPKTKSSYGEHPTLIIGRLKPLSIQPSQKSEVFVSALGKVAQDIEPGSEDLSWLRLGFQIEESKKIRTFGVGPIPIDRLPQILFSALEVFSVFYGVSIDSGVRTIGDPELEDILDNCTGLKRVKLGEYRMR